MEYFLSILFLLSFGGVGAFLLFRSVQLRRKGIFAIGTVTQINKTGRSYPTTVQFTTINGEEIQISGMSVSIPKSVLRIGNSVPLLYDPDNPKSAVEFNPITMWFIPLGFIGASILVLYIMIFLL